MMEEVLCDFNICLPRVIVSGNICIVDNIINFILVSDKCITVYNGKKYISINGENLVINNIDDERVHMTGEFRTIEFY